MLIKCQICQKEFNAYLSRKGKVKYCSRKCSSQARSTSVDCRCLQCGNKFLVKPSRIRLGNGKYCSPDCASIKKINRVERKCQKCSTKFYIKKSVIKRGGGKYCSVHCYRGKNNAS